MILEALAYQQLDKVGTSYGSGFFGGVAGLWDKKAVNSNTTVRSRKRPIQTVTEQPAPERRETHAAKRRIDFGPVFSQSLVLARPLGHDQGLTVLEEAIRRQVADISAAQNRLRELELQKANWRGSSLRPGSCDGLFLFIHTTEVMIPTAIQVLDRDGRVQGQNGVNRTNYFNLFLT